MARSYTHSVTFGSLKRIEEGIAHNLTSYQYLQTLDYLLWQAISRIYQACPDFVLNYVTKVVAHQTLKPATKFSSNERGTLPHILFNLLVFSDQKYLEELNLNRGLLFGLIAQFLKTVNRFKQVQDLRIRVSPEHEAAVVWATSVGLGLAPEANLPATIREVEYWDERSHWFKSLIVQKYVRMALLQAQSTYKELMCSVSLNDISQIYLMYVSKAIDRCDSRQGVLTTFIQSWLKSAKAEAAGLAKENYHSSYEELVEAGTLVGEVMPDLSYEELQHLAMVAQKFDKEGYVRASLGIPEFLSAKHRAVLQQFIPI